jgi:predicted FMN-binding regulatory protein PaiB
MAAELKDMAAAMVAARILVVLESKNPQTGQVYHHVSRATVVVNNASAVSSTLKALEEFHNTQKKQWSSQETRAGAPYWSVVAYTDPVRPFATGSERLSHWTKQLFGLVTGEQKKKSSEKKQMNNAELVDRQWLRDEAAIVSKSKTTTERKSLLIECLKRIARRYDVDVITPFV